MERETWMRADANPPLERVSELRQELAQVARERRYARRFGGVASVAPQGASILLDHVAAARRIDEYRLDRARFEERPPGVDVAAHVGKSARLVAEMCAQRSATSAAARRDRLDTCRVQHAHRRPIDVRPHRRLHAACEQQHLAPMLASPMLASPMLASPMLA